MIHSFANLKIGATKPFTIIHISDTHLTLVNDTDSLQIIDYSQQRKTKFPETLSFLESVSIEAHKKNAVIFHTGDMTDFLSNGNIDYLKNYMRKNDLQFTVGNHDFKTVDSAGAVVNTCNEENQKLLQQIYGNHYNFTSRIINGVNFVGISNIYYNFSHEQLEKLKKEVLKGLPIVLTVHIPFYERGLYDIVVQGNRTYASQIAVPLKLMKCYPKAKIDQQSADEFTKKAVDYIVNETSIKAILAGHVHKSFAGLVGGEILQKTVSLYEMCEIYIE